MMQCNLMMRLVPVLALAICGGIPAHEIRATVVDFGDLSLASESQWDGVDDTYNVGGGQYNTFSSQGTTFNNYHLYSNSSVSGPYSHYWESWAYSNRTNTASTYVAGQYTAMASPAGGQGDANYGVAFCGWYSTPTVTFASPTSVEYAYFTNNAYAYSSMLNGDRFSKQFGTGDNPNDWFKLTIAGYDANGASTGTIDFYLADFRSTNDYIIDEWTKVYLTDLGDDVKSLTFSLDSSDHYIDPESGGDWGMNTPSYFAMDNLTVTPEPSTIALLIAGAMAALAWRWRRK